MMEEIRLPYLSIPRLVYFRNGDLSLKALPEHLKALLHLLFYQTDGLPGNATERFGLIYYGTTPFFLIGAVLAAKQLAKSLRTRQLQPLPFLLIQLMAALLQGLSIPPNVNRVNILWPPVILLAAAGICALCRWIGGPRALLLPVLFYLALFARFELYYFGEYASSVTGYYADGLQDAVAAAAAHPGTICVSPSASYPRILFYTAQDPDEYRATVQYSNYPSAFLDVAGFGRFSFSFDPSQPDSSCVYLLDRSVDLEPLCSAGFTIEQYGGFSVAYHP